MMNVNFRTLDLNLLRVFDEVMAERNLTRAARNLSLTQPPQRVAHGRLRDRQVAGGAREVALCHHLVEDAEQVEIECAEIDVHQCCE